MQVASLGACFFARREATDSRALRGISLDAAAFASRTKRRTGRRLSSGSDAKSPIVLEPPDFINDRDHANQDSPQKERDDGAEEIA